MVALRNEAAYWFGNLENTDMKIRSLFVRSGLILLLLAGLGSPARVEAQPHLEGLWNGFVIFHPAQIEHDLTVEIAASPEGRLGGTIDVPVLQLKFHPLQNIQLEGSKVSFDFGLVPGNPDPNNHFYFKGDLSADGKKIAGEFNGRSSGQEMRFPFRLERTGEAGGDRPQKVKSPLVVMSDSGDELKAAFNRDKDKVRLVLLLSPTCPSCLSSANVIERYVLDTLKDDSLRVYTVWGPMLGDETEEQAREATSYINDPRVTHFWTKAHVVATQFARAAALPEKETGWDTYQLYPPGPTWNDAIPSPAKYMFINKPLSKELALDAEKLADLVRGYLAPQR
jgi:hypothetical protein